MSQAMLTPNEGEPSEIGGDVMPWVIWVSQEERG